jgi:Rrf2 family protein
MRLTKTTSHAIRIAIDCAEANGALVKVADIARRLDITPLNVFKIVHILSRAGFVEAMRGRHGGVRLARPAAQIRIGDIVRAIEATEIEVAGADAASTRDAKPGLNSIFDNALEAFIGVLDQHSLSDMAKVRHLTQPTVIVPPRKSRPRTARTTARNSHALRG